MVFWALPGVISEMGASCQPSSPQDVPSNLLNSHKKYSDRTIIIDLSSIKFAFNIFYCVIMNLVIQLDIDVEDRF